LNIDERFFFFTFTEFPMNDTVSLKTKQKSWPTRSIDKTLSGDF